MLQELENLLREYSYEQQELKDMQRLWEDGDCYAQASNDPGLQYEKEQYLENLYKDIKNLCKRIAEEE